MRLLDTFTHRRDRDDCERQVDQLCWAWRTACVGSGLCQVVGTATGPTESVPRIVDITLGPPLVFLVELLPGQVVSDVRAVAHRLAGPLGAVALRVESQWLRYVRVQCLTTDPLLGEVARAQPVVSARQPVMIGRDEQGNPVRIELDSGAHLVVQGSSGSGKSTGVYGVLAQLAVASDVLVVGSDVTNKLLSPWAARPGNPGWIALGTKNLAAHVTVLERAVREMDARIDQMPPGHDSAPITTQCPLMMVVLEEFPGLIRLLGTADKTLDKRARMALGRLFGEARKASMRLLLIAQRADANILGGFERDQASHTISFRVGNLAALSMLHQGADKAIAAEHATARPGVALMSAPGVPLCRFKAPYTTYADYCAEVTAAVATDGESAA